jgi:hypothetical protein
VVVIDGGWIYNYLCNQCLSPLKLVKSNPAHGEDDLNNNCSFGLTLSLEFLMFCSPNMFHKWTGPIHNEFAIAFKECKPFFVRCMNKSNMVNEFPSTYQIRVTVVVIDGGWIYNYLCNQCLSPLKLVKSNPAHGEVYLI